MMDSLNYSKKRRLYTVCGFLMLFSLFSGELFGAARPELPVVGIQWEMKEKYVQDQGLFWQDAERAIQQGLERLERDNGIQLQDTAVTSFSEDGKSSTEVSRPLVIFPEYTSVFLSLDRYHSFIDFNGDFLASWKRVQESFGYRTIEDLFTAESEETKSDMERWKELAKKYQIYLIPGTYFAYDSEEGELRNRLMLIDPSGKPMYQQDKVFTTDFENNYISLDGASVHDADVFSIAGKRIAVTICRDTFFDDWEGVFGGVDLWIDLKANGAEYDRIEQERFHRAVPERIDGGTGRYGMTLYLTGDFLDLFWEGRSSVITHDGEFVARTDDPDDFAILTFVLK
ncbi:MAG: carbon-nitrogen hydrolase family protein [Spirochaetia bacterium]|nr:carbon-nitrogen hydrolase family protein [Spirochaetia bacterium]